MGKKHLNSLNSESLEVGLKIQKGKTKYTRDHVGSEDLLIDQEKIVKVTEFKYLRQTTHPKDTTKKKSMPGSWQPGTVLESKNKEILQHRQLPVSLNNKKVMDECVFPAMTYGCQTWSLNKQTEDCSKSDGQGNVISKATRQNTMLRDQE